MKVLRPTLTRGKGKIGVYFHFLFEPLLWFYGYNDNYRGFIYLPFVMIGWAPTVNWTGCQDYPRYMHLAGVICKGKK